MNSGELNLLELILGASLPVQVVMVLLIAASIWSWWIIFRKRAVISMATRTADEFEERFWSGADLAQLYREVSNRGKPAVGLEGVFEAGFREFARLRQRRQIDSRTLIEGSQRAMRVALSREVDRLEQHLNNLATVGSISPYVGLFGTVWGIMNSFIGISKAQTTNLAVVAPGIAEALLATALGLVAAIPAVVIYNHFARRIAAYKALVGDTSAAILRLVSRDLSRLVVAGNHNERSE
ncbi:MAG: protein TolQ [Gammaproteobacteria bacterium]|nr:protein TolQ [Gammaproteobacteria bacterium]